MGKWKGNGKPALITGGLICLHNDQDNLSKNSEHLFLKNCNFLQFFSFLVRSGAVLAWPQQQPRSMVGGDAR